MLNQFILKKVGSEYENLHWIPNKMKTTTIDQMMEVAVKGFESGLLSAYEAKVKFLDYTDEEVQEDDKFRKIGNQVVKEGELQEGNVESEKEDETVQDEITFGINCNIKQDVMGYVKHKA
jgi:hypothetical protein